MLTVGDVVISGSGFLLLFLSDLFQAYRRPHSARLVSIFGYGGVGAALFFLVVAFRPAAIGEAGAIAEIGAAALFSLLLLYSVLVEIPFALRRLRPKGGPERRVFAGGTYSVVRHPGFIWFLGLAASLMIIYRDSAVTIASVAMILMNLTLVTCEDLWLFPRIFHDWEAYQRTVPFLIPRLRCGGRSSKGS